MTPELCNQLAAVHTAISNSFISLGKHLSVRDTLWSQATVGATNSAGVRSLAVLGGTRRARRTTRRTHQAAKTTTEAAPELVTNIQQAIKQNNLETFSAKAFSGIAPTTQIKKSIQWMVGHGLARHIGHGSYKVVTAS